MIIQCVTIITIITGIFFCIIPTTHAYASCAVPVECGKRYVSQEDSPIVISRDTLSSHSQVNILIHAPDFNSNPYAIDTIGEDGSRVIISTRDASIPYRLVETGPDTGNFAGYVVLSSTTSICSPICGPTDGFLAAGGDDAITVSFTYADGRMISTSSYGQRPIPMSHGAIPEFPFAELELLVGIMSLILFSKVIFIQRDNVYENIDSKDKKCSMQKMFK